MKITFNIKEEPIFPELRPSYKIAQILLILTISSRGHKSSLIRLHLFNWGLNSKDNILKLIQLAKGSIDHIDVWSVDPMLNQALAFAYADNLLSFQSGKYILTKRGLKLSEQIIENNFLENDIIFLKQINKKITEALINRIIEKWQ